jgi:hypothetical protein
MIRGWNPPNIQSKLESRQHTPGLLYAAPDEIRHTPDVQGTETKVIDIDVAPAFAGRVNYANVRHLSGMSSQVPLHAAHGFVISALCHLNPDGALDLVKDS